MSTPATAAGPRRYKWARRGAAVAVLIALGLGAFATTFTACPLPAPPAYEGSLPPAAPPSSMRVYTLPTGVTKRSAGFGYRGGSLFEARDFAMTAVLVRHPKGDLLIDTGLGRDIDARVGAMPWWFRAGTRYVRGRSAAEQLDAAGYDRRRLRAVLLTHAHWDHAAGLAELAGTPVWVTAEERRYVDEGGWTMDFVRGIEGVRWETYAFEGGPYLGFPKSHDVYGDGAIVVVPAPGHTPGSVIVFLATPSSARLALVGDLVWQREGILEREERPWLMRSLGDQDAGGVRDGILKMAALASRFPEMTLVPAHDTRGFAALEPLPVPLD